MHTILKRELTQSDFEEPIRIDILELLNSMIERKEFDNVKNHLPESFLQRRILFTNYKTLIGIIDNVNIIDLKNGICSAIIWLKI